MNTTRNFNKTPIRIEFFLVDLISTKSDKFDAKYLHLTGKTGKELKLQH